ncbi:hypothetical protein [Haloferula sp. BvORR071]|uniref:hypothetical protein n=1 Tax=Haloferula sp. BvORR071 TaxID=1396141 RepID=UPI00224102E7|nr:hypothetical protein [Haloferula sp. BvORR071]
MASHWPSQNPSASTAPTAGRSASPCDSLLSLSSAQFDQLLGDFLASLREVRRLKEELQRRRSATGPAAK